MDGVIRAELGFERINVGLGWFLNIKKAVSKDSLF
jgi:hypothetical protein